MQRYVEQLLEDIRTAKTAAPTPWFEQPPEDEEDDFGDSNGLDPVFLAPWRSIESWTGISKMALPPADRLTDDQQHDLLEALKELLSALRCHVVFQQTNVPLALQYAAVREGFDQRIPLSSAKDHFFAFCQPEQDPDTCLLGKYCECRLLDPSLSDDGDHLPFEQDAEETYERFLPLQFNEEWFGGPPHEEEDDYRDELQEEDLDEEDEENNN